MNERAIRYNPTDKVWELISETGEAIESYPGLRVAKRANPGVSVALRTDAQTSREGN